jgi:K+-transporting ATPase ATPase A chain
VTFNAIERLAAFFAVLILAAPPLGGYMARVFTGEPVFMDRLTGGFERLVYRLLGVDPAAEMSWKSYAGAVLAFSLAGSGLLYLLLRAQGSLPLNHLGFPGLRPDLAFNTAVSFVTNTNWQAYAGETTLGYLVQMAGLGVQNFLSAATGMAVLAALIRGFTRRESAVIGNFWVDLTRSVTHVLLPLSFLLALALVSQGVVQSLAPYRTVPLLQPVAIERTGEAAAADSPDGPGAGRVVLTRQVLPLGPVASQTAIKQLGTNGGGFFNANSAHPFENPTPLSNFLEVVAILLLPVSLCYTFGRMVGDIRQGRALAAVMFAIFLPLLVTAWWSEGRGNPALTRSGADQAVSDTSPGGTMEGKEVRFGIVDSALWATATTAASNGSVNAMLDSFTPLGGMVPLVLIQLGEVVFGGVGSGLYGMLAFAVLAVFVAGLMVGRTPEYLGKKIEAFEMKMAFLVVLVPASLVKIGTAVAVAGRSGTAGIANPGPHGFTEILYAFSSAANNNGSAFAGLDAGSVFYNLALGAAMFIGRFWVIVPILAMAGSLAAKKHVPPGPGTLPTDTPLFVAMVVGVVVVVGALTFFPALALGPLAEHLAPAP